jgi:hypothetical protein
VTLGGGDAVMLEFLADVGFQPPPQIIDAAALGLFTRLRLPTAPSDLFTARHTAALYARLLQLPIR